MNFNRKSKNVNDTVDEMLHGEKIQANENFDAEKEAENKINDPGTEVDEFSEKADLGGFDFHNFVDSTDGRKKGNPVFIGVFDGKIWHGQDDKGDWKVSDEEPDGNVHGLAGIHFKDDAGDKKLISPNHQLVKYFASQGVVGKRYKIVFKGYKDIGGGQKMAEFDVFPGNMAK